MKKFLLFFIVLISVIIYFSTTQSRENYRLFKQMCKNKEYRIEIVDENYTVEDIKQEKFYLIESNAYDSCHWGLKCPNKTELFHTRNIIIIPNNDKSYKNIINNGRYIAKVYEIFRPYSSLEIALDFEGAGIYGSLCTYRSLDEIKQILIENLNKKDKK